MPISSVSTTTTNNIATNPVSTSSVPTTELRTAFWNLISGIVEVARSFFATLPFIGRFFEVAPPTPRIRSEDELRYKNVKEILNFERRERDGTYHPGLQPIRNENVARALDVFRQIQDPFYKTRAFRKMIIAPDATDYAAREFYNALPEQLQRDFREQIYIANERYDNNLGIGFGEHIITTDIRGQLARTAACQLHFVQRRPT